MEQLHRYRWSDGHSYAKEFTATDATLYDAAMNALIDARRETGRRYHDGGKHTNNVTYPRLQLHWKRPSGRDIEWYQIGGVPMVLTVDGSWNNPQTPVMMDPSVWIERRDAVSRHADNLDSMIGQAMGAIERHAKGERADG